MNTNTMVANSSRKNQGAKGRHFLLGTAIVLLVVLGCGVGISLSKQASPESDGTVLSGQLTGIPARVIVERSLRAEKARSERWQNATLEQDDQMTMNPEKKRKLALLLLLTGGQAHNVRL